MERHPTEAVYARSDKTSHDFSMTTNSDNEILTNGGVKNRAPGMPRHDGQVCQPDGDLQLWLEHTGFFDIEYRQKVLGSLRKLKAINEQRSEILLEIQNTAGVVIMPNVSHKCHNSSSNTDSFLLSPSTSLSEKQRVNTASSHPYCNGCASKDEPRKTTSPMIGQTHEPRSSGVFNDRVASVNGSVDLRGRRIIDQRDGVSVSPHVYQRDLSIAGASSICSRATPEPLETEPTKLLQSLADNEACRSDVGVPRMVSNMNGQEVRYFLIKSFNTLNVEMSQRDGLWVTKATNGPVLTEAFNKCKNVILFFSINKSKAFQGYARMVTAPCPDIAKAEWMSNIDWEPSDPFRIEWLNKHRTDFWKVGDLRNPFNDGAPVFIGRDGQEYSGDCGRKMVKAMDQSTEKRDVGSSWAIPCFWDSAAKAKCDSREDLRRVDRPNWRRTELSSTEHACTDGDEAESYHSMTLIDY